MTINHKYIKIENDSEIEYIKSDTNIYEYDLYSEENCNDIAKNIKINYNSN